MTIKYIYKDWVFNKGMWAQAVAAAIDEHGDEVVATLVGVAKTTVKNWSMMYETAYDEFPYPNMTNCIAFCNAFDIDIRDMFIIEE